ncbi:MAG: amidase [Gammaproteobacteria bacterium]|nr:MAG: amidase [Gammaproteobacteria bacterium]
MFSGPGATPALAWLLIILEYLNKTASQQLEALRGGEISAVELLEQTIARAEKLIPDLNPFALTLYGRARQAAQEADKKLAAGSGGKLCGLPITIKDSQFLAGYACANGSHILRDFIPNETCRAVEILEQEDAIIFAKTTCPEFSLTGVTHSEIYGLTSNPWDIERTCGGSSGGAATAVAAGLGAFSLGGDGGGSIRIPAGFCGIVGFKPSFGVIPREPCFPSWQSIVSYGPMTRGVADARLFFEILAERHQAGPGKFGTKGPIIFSEDLGFAPVNQDVREAFRKVIALMSDADFDLVEDNPGLSSSVITWAVTACYDAAEHAKGSAYNLDYLGEVARGFIDFGDQFSEEEFEQAQAHRNVIRTHYAEMFERHGSCILITPTLGCEAFPHGSIHPHKIDDTHIELPWLDWASFLYDANLVGMPACAIPMGLGDEGLPLSLQILGPEGSDYEVLRVAAAIEKLVGWDNSIVTPESGPLDRTA